MKKWSSIIVVFLIVMTVITFYIFSPEKKESVVYVLTTTDMHGDFEHIQTQGSMLDVVDYLSERKSLDSECLITIDCGDFSVGSPEANATQGRFPYACMEAAHYDVIVPGNHEFDYGVDSFLEYLNILKHSEILCANIKIESDTRIKAWTMLKRDRKKIAIIGLATPNLRKSSHIFLVDSRIEFNSNLTQSIEKIMPDVLNARPDYIILAMHAGEYTHYKQFKKLLKAFPQIRLIFGGHSHQLEKGKVVGKNGWFVQSGNRCNSLIESKIYFSKNDKPWCQTQNQLSFLKSEKKSLFSQELHKIQNELNRKLCDFSLKKWDWARTNDKKIDLNAILLKAVEREYNANILWSSLREKSIVKYNSFTYNDLYKLFLYNNDLVACNLTTIKLEKLCRFLNRKKGTRLMLFDFQGITYKRDGESVRAKYHFYFPNGEKIPPHFQLKMLTTLYQLQGAGIYSPEIKAILFGEDVYLKTLPLNLLFTVEKYLKK